MKIAIIGRKKDTANYEKYLSEFPAAVLTTLYLGDLVSCDAVILPGGGDITPAFFGEKNSGSLNIDTELDILQFQALDYCLKCQIPVMGICKGMQVINVALGGTLFQEWPSSALHRYQKPSPANEYSACGDQYHLTKTAPDSFLHQLYGESFTVNSAHHQSLNRLGRGLVPIQWCEEDNCIEAVTHSSLPVFGLQWHPERLKDSQTEIDGNLLLAYLASLADTSHSYLHFPSGQQ